ncbi:MAG: hypothetical protein AAFX93_18195 [Verrucomicrobiota bacterium]
MKSFAFSSFLTLAAAGSLLAQDGIPASDAASQAPDNKPFAVNTEAWDSFVSFNGERIFGDPKEHNFIPAVAYYSSYTVSGKRVAKSTIVPSFSTNGPMFGGEGYGTITGVLPLEGDFVNQLNFNGGWKYNLMEYLGLDVGGGFSFYSENSFGDGQPNQFGSYYRNKIYFGLIGRVPLSPAAYAVYDMQLEQIKFVAGVSETIDLAEDWSIFGEGRFGYASANSYLGDSRAPLAGKWSNGYAYWLLSADLRWNAYKGLVLTAGVGYTGNNDGTRGIANIDLGPENTVYGKFSVSYSF